MSPTRPAPIEGDDTTGPESAAARPVASAPLPAAKPAVSAAPNPIASPLPPAAQPGGSVEALAATVPAAAPAAPVPATQPVDGVAAAVAAEAGKATGRAATPAEAKAAERPQATTQSAAGAPADAAAPVQSNLTAVAVKAIHGVSAAAAAFVTRLRGEQKPAAADGTADPMQAAVALPQTLGPSAAVVAAPAQTVPSRGRVPVAKVGHEIAKAAAAGETKFEMRLDPAGLGGVDVSLTFTDEGDVRAHLSVERPETLDMLKGDQRQIERTLRDAGFDAQDGSVSLSMRQNGGDGERQAQQRAYQTADQSRAGSGRAADTEPTTAAVADAYRPRRDALVDLRL